jgi:hypothetical protein
MLFPIHLQAPTPNMKKTVKFAVGARKKRNLVSLH